MRTGIIAALGVLLLALAGCGSSGDAEPTNALGLRTAHTLLVGSDISTAPFEFTAPGSGRAQGFDVDFTYRASAEQADGRA